MPSVAFGQCIDKTSFSGNPYLAVITYLIEKIHISSALLEEPPILQSLKDFPGYHETRRIITVFTRALHWSPS
jgi:hypothetical protein